MSLSEKIVEYLSHSPSYQQSAQMFKIFCQLAYVLERSDLNESLNLLAQLNMKVYPKYTHLEDHQKDKYRHLSKQKGQVQTDSSVDDWKQRDRDFSISMRKDMPLLCCDDQLLPDSLKLKGSEFADLRNVERHIRNYHNWLDWLLFYSTNLQERS